MKRVAESAFESLPCRTALSLLNGSLGVGCKSTLRLSVYDILGREVSLLVNERKNAASCEVKFSVAGLASGVYFCRLVVGDVVSAKKLAVVQNPGNSQECLKSTHPPGKEV